MKKLDYPMSKKGQKHDSERSFVLVDGGRYWQLMKFEAGDRQSHLLLSNAHRLTNRRTDYHTIVVADTLVF